MHLKSDCIFKEVFDFKYEEIVYQYDMASQS